MNGVLTTKETWDYYRALGIAREMEVEERRDEATKALLGCAVFVSEKVGDSRALGPLLAALQAGDDAEAGRRLRAIVTAAASEAIDDVARGISHGGDLDEMIKWWQG